MTTYVHLHAVEVKGRNSLFRTFQYEEKIISWNYIQTKNIQKKGNNDNGFIKHISTLNLLVPTYIIESYSWFLLSIVCRYDLFITCDLLVFFLPFPFKT